MGNGIYIRIINTPKENNPEEVEISNNLNLKKVKQKLK
jgi:hypothetical protein